NFAMMVVAGTVLQFGPLALAEVVQRQRLRRFLEILRGNKLLRVPHAAGDPDGIDSTLPPLCSNCHSACEGNLLPLAPPRPTHRPSRFDPRRLAVHEKGDFLAVPGAGQMNPPSVLEPTVDRLDGTDSIGPHR